MRGLRTWSLIALFAVSALALSGCTTNAVTVAYQGGSFGGSNQKSLECMDGHGVVSYGIQGGAAGTVKVTVTDDDGNTIHSSSFSGGGKDGKSSSISGTPGTWTLKVSNTGAFSGQYAITLSC